MQNTTNVNNLVLSNVQQSVGDKETRKSPKAGFEAICPMLNRQIRGTYDTGVFVLFLTKPDAGIETLGNPSHRSEISNWLSHYFLYYRIYEPNMVLCEVEVNRASLNQ